MMKLLARGSVFDAAKAPSNARFCTFPDVLSLTDGGLLVAFRAGSSKQSLDESIWVMHSDDDDGTTWRSVFESVETHWDTTPGSMRLGGLAELSPGRLLGAFRWTDRSDPTLPLLNPETQGILPSKIVVAESTDMGRSWNSRRAIPLDPNRGYALTGGIRILRNGTLLLPFEIWKTYYDTSPGQHDAAAVRSLDQAQTWSAPVIVAHDPQNRTMYWDQRLTVDPDDGRPIAMFWTHDRLAERDVEIHISWGTPDGLTWMEPVSTGIAGQICTPLALPGGRLVATYVHRHDPPSLRVRLSNDGGRTWEADELIIYESGGGRQAGMQENTQWDDYWTAMYAWTFGHPAATLLPSGRVLVVYYAGDPTGMGIHWVCIDP